MPLTASRLSPLLGCTAGRRFTLDLAVLGRACAAVQELRDGAAPWPRR